MSILNKPYFHDEAAAVAKLESIVWRDGPVCPKCGVIGEAYELKGKRARPGLRRCKAPGEGQERPEKGARKRGQKKGTVPYFPGDYILDTTRLNSYI